MKRCPSCKAVIKPEALKCPSCGVLVHSVTQNNEILKKDKWSFTGVADALDRKEMDPKAKEVRQFDKTMAMGVVDSRKDDLHQTLPLQLGGPTSTKAKISKEDVDSSQSPNLTVPIPLKESAPTKVRMTKDEVERDLNLTAPLPLLGGVSTQAGVSKGGGAPEGVPKLTAPIPLSEAVSTKAKVKREPVSSEEPKIKTAPLEPQVLVESKSKKIKATAPLGIAVPAEHLELKKRMQTGLGTSDSIRTGRIIAAVASAVLIATWFLPNIWIKPPVFPMDLLEVVRGLHLVALVVPPFVGAIVLTLLIAPIYKTLRASVILILGCCALAVPLLFGEPALPLQGYISLTIVIAATAASVVILTQTTQSVLGYISLALLPATFLGVAVYGIVVGKLPIANISSLKDPVNVYAGMVLIAVSAKELIKK